MAERLPSFTIEADRQAHKPFHADLWMNGKVIWTTPRYVHRAGVHRAMEIVCGSKFVPAVFGNFIRHNGYGSFLKVVDNSRTEPSR